MLSRSAGFFSVFLLAVALSGCGGADSSGSATLKQIAVPGTTDPGGGETGSDPLSRPQVISGWLDAYSAHVEDRVSRDYPALLGLADSRMAAVCPAWSRLDRAGREKFWSSMLWAIAGPESSRNRCAIYRETTMSTDSVTGQQIRSEGLLQLSYVDVASYHYPEGDISWERDKALALADYAAGKKVGNSGRTILNAYSNLNLGLFIMNRLLTGAYASQTFEGALGHYWATMKTSESTFKSVVVPNLKKRMPECFQ